MKDTDRYRVKPGQPVDLSQFPSREDGGLDREDARQRLRKLLRRLDQLQELMYAQNKHSLLVVMQAMDAGGKDSTIRRVFGPLNPQGVIVTNFKQPTSHELARDYLWRIHQAVPPRGHIGVFNRSHYEDVLIVRVKNLVPAEQWRKRYDHINAFEQLLRDEGTLVLKFFLHISRQYQRKRLQRRLDRPDKHWKFDAGDLKERAHWDDYRTAFEEALSRCSTDAAPWYIVPAERRWFRNLLVAQVVHDALVALDMKYPQPTVDVSKIVIR